MASIFETSRTFRALRHRNYRLFVGGQLVSLIGAGDPPDTVVGAQLGAEESDGASPPATPAGT